MKAGHDPYFTPTEEAKPHPPRGMARLAVLIPWCLSWLPVALLFIQVLFSSLIYRSRLVTGAFIMSEVGAGALGAIGAFAVLVIRLVRSRGSSDPYTRRLAWSILRGLLFIFMILAAIEVA